MDKQQPQMAYEVDGQFLTEEQVVQMQTEKLQRVQAFFVGLRDRWVAHRTGTGVEARWRRAQALYLGQNDGEAQSLNSMENTLRNGPTSRGGRPEQPRSKVVINIVRPKVDQAVARMCEILFPVDDQNWGIKPTPVPQLANRTGNRTPTVDPATGKPTGVTAADEAQAVIEDARKKAEGMQREISDNLTECNYNGESRLMIEDGVRLGTGIMKGPFPVRSTTKAFVNGAIKKNVSIKPASARRDPWDIYFDPSCGNNHQRGRGVIERRRVTRKEIRALIGVPGYDEAAIKKVLLEEPRRITVGEGRVTNIKSEDESYEMWEYHGEIEPEDFELMTSKTGDPVQGVSFGLVIMINSTVIGALKSWCAEDEMPYDVWCWRKDDNSPYGYGLPHELDNQQSVINGSWRMLMDNSRASMGGQIVMKRGKIVPANGNPALEPMKLWYAADDEVDVTKAFSVFEFNSHAQELLAVATKAMEFADLEANMPQIMGGQQAGATPETLGGTIMAFNNASSVLRKRVKTYDDCITRPHINRYNDWHLLLTDKPEIKGDHEIDARGSSALVERDIQNQALINLAAITNNPRYVPHLKEREELKAILKAFKVNPEELMKTEDEVQADAERAAQNPPQDPKVISAQTQLQIKEMDIMDKKEQRAFEAGRNAAEIDFRNRNLQYNAMREQSEAEQASVDAQLQRELALIKINADTGTKREGLISKNRLEMIRIADGRERFNAEAALRMRTGQGI